MRALDGSHGTSLCLVPCPLSTGAWCYDSQDPKCGPTRWKELAPACEGPDQSPINIDLCLVQRDATLGPFIFQGYDSAPPGPWTLENDGHTELPVDSRGWLPSPVYQLLQLHFHWGSSGHTGSEHSLDEKHSTMEMHLIHMNTEYKSMGEARSHPNGLVVLAVLLAKEDGDNTNFSAIVSGLKNLSSPGVSINLTSTFPLASLLPSGLLPYYRYSRSLTTPGCEPAVLWTVFENTVPIEHAQVGGAQFQTVPQAGPLGLRVGLLRDNFHPQQPLGRHRVSASPGASIRAAV
uniref:Carbonic anhydrase 15 n=1 Tax=Nannospalax galili TaxID=1026970 RepID=A0A8C6QXK0_NANGA